MARSSWLAITSSNHRRMTAERCAAVLARQEGQARFAASMARRVSAAPMFGTTPSVVPVAGFVTGMEVPPSAAAHVPSM